MRFFLIACFVLNLIPICAFASPAQQTIMLAEQLNLAQDNTFKRLLHYEGGTSLVEKGSPFFISPDGYHNPESELAATIQSFYKKDVLDDSHALCRFPARFSYLQKQLNLSVSDLPKPECKQYNEFRQKVRAQSVSLVFAAENNTSPSSMMGHLVFLPNSPTKIQSHFTQRLCWEILTGLIFYPHTAVKFQTMFLGRNAPYGNLKSQWKKVKKNSY